MLDRVAKYHHNDCSVDNSTTDAPIENRTTGDDFLWCNIPSANGIKKLDWFCITGYGIATGTPNQACALGSKRNFFFPLRLL